MEGSYGSEVEVPIEIRVCGPVEDKKRCGMVEEDRCVLCGLGEVEDVRHFVLECKEFEWDRCELLRRLRRIEGAERWVAE